MDGNRRWARHRNLEPLAGHRAGSTTLKKICRAAIDQRIKWLTVFAFSSENWQRPSLEVEGLFGLIKFFVKTQANEILDNNVRLRVVGRRDRFSVELKQLIEALEFKSSLNNFLNLTVALDYGGCQDVVNAMAKIAHEIERGLLSPSDVSDDLIKSRLSTNVLPPVDLLIRTGGEKRISNFLLWDIAYAELYFTDALWPDFNGTLFENAINEFQSRDRRFGGSSNASTHLRVIKSDLG